jgi:hypothetical protein
VPAALGFAGYTARASRSVGVVTSGLRHNRTPIRSADPERVRWRRSPGL